MFFLRMFLSLACALSLFGCGSVGLLTVDNKVNLSVGSMDTVIVRYEALAERVKAGEKVDRKSALLALGILDEKKVTVESLRRTDIQAYLFGGASIFAGDTNVIQLLDHMTGVRIPFIERKEHITLSSGVYVSTNESGYDFAIVLIFKDGFIRNADQIGVLAINRTSKRIIWNPASHIDGAPGRK